MLEECRTYKNIFLPSALFVPEQEQVLLAIKINTQKLHAITRVIEKCSKIIEEGRDDETPISKIAVMAAKKMREAKLDLVVTKNLIAELKKKLLDEKK
jgi:hypothetical protein